jgi:hypothetical protein
MGFQNAPENFDLPDIQEELGVQDDEVRMIVHSLALIVEAFGGVPEKGKTDFWTKLSEKLSRIAGKKPAWDWRYPAQVYAEQTKPSILFGRAVMALGAALDETPIVETVYTVQVRVYARPDAIKDGSIVIGESKPCARPGCKVLMVPNVPWRKYCSDECAELAAKESNLLGKDNANGNHRPAK